MKTTLSLANLIGSLLSGLFISALFSSAPALANNGAIPLPQEIYSCFAKFENNKFGIIVRGQFEDDLYAELVGTKEKGMKVKFKVYDLPEALDVPFVSDIIQKLNLTAVQTEEAAGVVVYTAGNFEDDLAGVRAISVINRWGMVLTQGMYFGWSGAWACDSNQ